MSANADTLINLVQGSAAAITTEFEDAVPGPWNEKLREEVRLRLEAGIGPVVATVAEALILAHPSGADALRQATEESEDE